MPWVCRIIIRTRKLVSFGHRHGRGQECSEKPRWGVSFLLRVSDTVGPHRAGSCLFLMAWEPTTGRQEGLTQPFVVLHVGEYVDWSVGMKTLRERGALLRCGDRS